MGVGRDVGMGKGDSSGTRDGNEKASWEWEMGVFANCTGDAKYIMHCEYLVSAADYHHKTCLLTLLRSVHSPLSIITNNLCHPPVRLNAV